MKVSESAFGKYVLPVLTEKLEKSGLYYKWESTEGVTHLDEDNETNFKLDVCYGIDCISTNIKTGKQFYYAIRNQFNSRDWGTFTIRLHRQSGSKTEWQKLQDAVDNDGLMPDYHMQSYLDGSNNVIAIYRVRTKDIVDYIRKYGTTVRQNYSDGTSFYVVYAEKMKDKGYSVDIIRPSKEINLDNAIETWSVDTSKLNNNIKKPNTKPVITVYK